MTLENQKQRWPIIIGALLILGGVVLLLGTFGVLNLGALFWAGAFVIAGSAFLTVFVQNRAHWWALIPGMALLGVAATIAGAEFFPVGSFIHEVAGAFVLFAIALSFALIYLRDPKQWWPIIPMGALLSVTAITVLATTTQTQGEVLGSVLFFGMALTFLVVALIPSAQRQTRWAFIPAAILGLMGVLIAGAFTQVLAFVWPIALILGGLVLLIGAMWRRSH
jgi:hypothetical protein